MRMFYKKYLPFLRSPKTGANTWQTRIMSPNHCIMQTLYKAQPYTAPIIGTANAPLLRTKVAGPLTFTSRLHAQKGPPGGSGNSFDTEWTISAIVQYICDITEVTTDHLTPELRLRLITPKCSLWSGRGEDCLVPDPFWAFYWPGGQALTRYVLDNPKVVRGRTVLDVGSGCGASALAARMSGAKRVVANDICPVSAEAIKWNALLNNVTLDVDTRNLIGDTNYDCDVIFLGDMFYDEDFTNLVTGWLDAMYAQGKTILIGDPGRVYFEKHPIKKRLKMLYSIDLLKHTMEENNGITSGYVWTFT